MQAPLLNTEGREVGKIDLPQAVFGLKPSREFLHEYTTVYLANQRRGTAHTKTRSEVSGGGKKPWTQKHTGRARAGSNRSPLWRHGGIVFGPRCRVPHLDFPRRKARLALAHALAARYAVGGIVFIDDIRLAEAKTKAVAGMLKQLGCSGPTTLVLDRPDQNVARAGRNIPSLDIRLASDLNAYGVLRSRRLVVTKSALEKLGGRWN